jgi:hypothetical protein
MMEIERDLRTSIPAKYYIYLLGIDGTIRKNRMDVAQASGSPIATTNVTSGRRRQQSSV